MLVSQSDYNAYPANWNVTDCRTTDRLCNNLGSAHQELVAQGVYPTGSLAWVHPFEEYYAQAPAAFKQLGVTRAPALLFYDVDNQTVVGVLKGAQITKQNIINRYLMLQELTPGHDAEGTFGYYKKDGKFIPLAKLSEQTGGVSLFSFPLFNLNLSSLFGDKVALWAWLIAAGFFGFKTFDTDNPNKRALYGALAGIAGINYYNLKKRT